MPKHRVTARMLDGRELVHEGNFMTLADRVAFERRYQMTATVMGRLEEAFTDEGRLKPEADAAGVREEWVAFMVWRVLARKDVYGAQVGSFDDFLERVDAVLVEQVKEPEEEAGALQELDPTVPTPPMPS